MNILTKSKKENVICCIICFFITICLAALAYAKMQIYPGGKYTLLTYDLAAQDLPMIASLRYIGRKDCSLIFSMLGGLGVNYWAIFSYYLSSPINLLTVFVPLEYMPDAIYCIILLKLGLCSVSFFLYAIYGLKQLSLKPLVILLSVCYGLSSYNMFYSMTLKYLDGLILLPIILIGVEKMIHEKKHFLYILTLTLSLYSNFYITYMSGLFVFLYLIYRLVSINISKKECFAAVKSFFFSSVLSLGLSMPIILPALRYMLIGKFSETVSSDIGIIRVTPLRILRNLFPLGEYFIRNGGAPQIYCGIVTIVLVILFFISKTFSRKEKTIVSSVFVFYFISFLLVPLDRMWHGFMDPVCFPARYSFTCICFMLIVACRSLESDRINTIQTALSGKTTPALFVLFIVVFFELYLNGSNAVMEINRNSNYVMSYKYKSDITQTQDVLASVDDDSLYRTVSSRPFSAIDGFLFGYNDVGLFSSVYNGEENDFLGSMGLYRDGHKFLMTGITPVMESLLGVKYRLGNQADYYAPKYVTGKEPRAIYLSPNPLSIGYMVRNSNNAPIYGENPFENQQNLLGCMVGKRINIFNENAYRITDVDDNDYARSCKIDTVLSDDGPVWLYYPLGSEHDREIHDIDTSISINGPITDRIEECKCVVNDNKEYDIMDKKSSWCVYIGDYKKGSTLSIKTRSTTFFKDPYIVTMNESKYRQAIDDLSHHMLNVTSHGNGIIEGTVTGIPGKTLAVSLPYMEGYRVYVDGKQVSYAKYNPAMISIAIPEGEHYIRISYICPGLIPGIIIGATALGALLLMMKKTLCLV